MAAAPSTQPVMTGSRMPAPAPLPHLPGLDGVRALAVLGVLLFHAGAPWLPGGFLGVDVFFVLSGFLITSLLLVEAASPGGLSFARFYAGRARRLLPALLLTLLLTALLVLTVAPDALVRFREDAVAAALYLTNWAYIADGQSYFEAMGRPPMLQHLWSLAIEEQFYLVWPVVAMALYHRGGRGRVGLVALLVALASAALMALLAWTTAAPGSGDASRLYFGTDTHSMGLLLGAALACVWRPGQLSGTPRRATAAALTFVGMAALAGVVALFHLAREDSPWLYRWGFAAISAAAACLVMVAAHPGLRFGRWLSLQPMTYLGQRSYGLYLYHWPIFLVLRPGVDVDLPDPVAAALALAVTAAVAELSYRFVEIPIRRGVLGGTWRRWRARGLLPAVAGATATAVAAVLVAGAAVHAVATTRPPAPADYLAGVTSVGGDLARESGAAPRMRAAGAQQRSAAADAPDPETRPDCTDGRVTAIGDSVMLGARDGLAEHLERVTVDATVSRHVAGVKERILSRQAWGVLAPTVVIHTGTNGPAGVGELDDLGHSLRDTECLVFVTVRTPHWWMDVSNDSLREFARKNPEVRIADWAAESAGHSNYFVKDGTHLTAAGIAAYSRLIARTLRG